MKFKTGDKVTILRGIHQGRKGIVKEIQATFHGNRVGSPYKVRVIGSSQSHLEGYSARDLRKSRS